MEGVSLQYRTRGGLRAQRSTSRTRSPPSCRPLHARHQNPTLARSHIAAVPSAPPSQRLVKPPDRCAGDRWLRCPAAACPLAHLVAPKSHEQGGAGASNMAAALASGRQRQLLAEAQAVAAELKSLPPAADPQQVACPLPFRIAYLSLSKRGHRSSITASPGLNWMRSQHRMSCAAGEADGRGHVEAGRTCQAHPQAEGCDQAAGGCCSKDDVGAEVPLDAPGVSPHPLHRFASATSCFYPPSSPSPLPQSISPSYGPRLPFSLPCLPGFAISTVG